MNADSSFSWTSGPTSSTPAPQSGARNPDLCGKAPARILVVDDDPDVRNVLGSALQLFNYQVDTAEDGAAAWESLCASSYALVITDHMMPRLTGLELLRRLRTVRPDVPCILISGDLPAVEADLAPVLCPGRAVDKPVRLEALIAMVRSLLAAHPVKRASAQSGNGHLTLCPA